MDDDLRAGNGKIHQIRHASSCNAYRHIGSDFSAEFANRFVQSPSLRVFAADLHNAVASSNAQFESGRSRQRRNHREDVVAKANRNADAAEFPFRRNLQILVILRGENRRMRIQNVSHSLNRRFGKFRRIHTFYIFQIDFRKNFVQPGKFLVKIARGFLFGFGSCG